MQGHPGQRQESEASAMLCIWCPTPLAEGNKLACEQHREQIRVTDLPERAAVTVTPAPAIGRDDLLALAEQRGWEALPFKRGESAGGTEPMWRTFAESARGKTLQLVLAAVWERWRDTVEQYSQPAVLVVAVPPPEVFEASTEWQAAR